jgi:hypothetical protein
MYVHTRRVRSRRWQANVRRSVGRAAQDLITFGQNPHAGRSINLPRNQAENVLFDSEEQTKPESMIFLDTPRKSNRLNQ